jgi:hypothetical protein
MSPLQGFTLYPGHRFCYNNFNPSGFSNENAIEYQCKQSRRDVIFIANDKHRFLRNAEGVTLFFIVIYKNHSSDYDLHDSGDAACDVCTTVRNVFTSYNTGILITMLSNCTDVACGVSNVMPAPMSCRLLITYCQTPLNFYAYVHG